MTEAASQQGWRHQIERLLSYPGVGALTPQAIAVNLGTTLEEIDPVLQRMVQEQRLAALPDGRLKAQSADRSGQRRGRQA